MAIATLSIDIEAKLAKLQDGMDRAVAVSESGAKRLEGVFAAASAALAVFAAAAPVAALASIVNHAVDVTGAMKDMQESFGASVDGLSQIRAGAALGGKTIADMEGPLSKLVKSLDEAGDSSSDAARALEALGLNVADIRQMSPDQAFIAIANATQDYADGAGKAAVMTALFGKEGAKLIPTLNDVAEVGGKYLKITQAQIDAADQYDKNMKRLAATFDDFKVRIGNAAIPALNALADEFKDASTAGLGFFEIINQVGRMKGPFNESWGKKAADARRDIEGLKKAIENLGPLGNVKFIKENYESKLADKQRLYEFYKARQAAEALGDDPESNKDPRDRQGSGNKPDVGFSGNAPPKTPKAKAKKVEDPLGDFIQDAEARYKPFEDSLKRLRDISLDAAVANAELTRSERALYDIVNSPEWQAMSEPLKDVIRAEAEAAIVAEKAATDMKRLNELLAATDSARLEKTRADMKLLAEALEGGTITAEQFEEAATAALGNVADKGKQEFDDLERIIDGWGKDSAKSIATALTSGKASLADFADFANRILSDVLAQMIYKNVTGPATTALSSVNWGAMFGFADGGIMSSAGPLPLKAYASGGVATSPQIALFGEGHMNEAFVPLPDGRSIPVTMKGRGSGGVQSVRVEIINETSQPARAASVQPTLDVDGMVVRVVLRDLNNNGPIRQALGA
ncbi:hypothetical protein [Zoogloea sp.]|uniref:hypothetical protein n=1 Tax=Zoogloea sp. TaxID=49181 RepID=UPI0035B4B2A0